MAEILSGTNVVTPTLVLLTLTSLTLLLARDWRWMAGALAVQYLGVFVLTAFSWPLLIALVKLVAGWMAVVILSVTIANSPESWPAEQPEMASRIFRVFAAGITFLVFWAISQEFVAWISELAPLIVSGALILSGLGLLQLGLTTQPVRVIIGLLTVLSGFEILYAALENSLLVGGLLAALTLGIALTGAYLAVVPFLEEPPA
jgi:hypothetical protein